MLTQIDDRVVDFFLKGSHHRNLHVFLLVQNLYNKKIREISLNAHVVIIFKSRRDLAQIKTFCTQVEPANWRAVFAAYQDATAEPGFPYFLFDFHPATPEMLRFRSKILPHEAQTFYVLKKKKL